MIVTHGPFRSQTVHIRFNIISTRREAKVHPNDSGNVSIEEGLAPFEGPKMWMSGGIAGERLALFYG